MDQAALTTPFSTPRVMSEQRHAIAQAIEELPAGTIGIIPTGVDQPHLLSGFSIVNDRVLIKLTCGEVEHSDTHHITLHQRLFDQLLDVALYASDAVNLIRAL